MVYIAITGAVFAFLQFGEIIARKSLVASGFHITLLVMLMPIAALTSLWWARLIEGRDQRKLLLTIGSIAFLALASGSMLSSIYHLLSIHFVYFLAFALIGPSENRVLQQYISPAKTGKTFGMASSIRMGVAAIVSGLAGLWMEHQPAGYRNIYPIVALIGFIALGFLASVHTGGVRSGAAVRINRRFFLSPLKDVVKLLRRRKDYLRFELAFMVYGVAFMMTLPVTPLYLVDDLQLGYDVIGFARGTLSQLVMIVAIPLFGYLFDKSTPHRMATMIFMALAGFPLLLIAAGRFSGDLQLILVYASFVYFGTVMSGVTVLWQLSSIRFSQEEDAGVYHSVHVAATGIRGMFAPLLGYLVMSTVSKTAAFICGSCLFLISGLLMILMRRIDVKRGEDLPLGA